MQQCCIW